MKSIKDYFKEEWTEEEIDINSEAKINGTYKYTTKELMIESEQDAKRHLLKQIKKTEDDRISERFVYIYDKSGIYLDEGYVGMTNKEYREYLERNDITEED